jgi:hypothetical protein
MQVHIIIITINNWVLKNNDAFQIGLAYLFINDILILINKFF